jgi:hypothetical protein
LFSIWYLELIVFNAEARVKPSEGCTKAFDHFLAACGYGAVGFVQMIEKLRFLFCVIFRFFADSFVAVDPFYDLVPEVLRASFDQIQDSFPKNLAR